MISATAIFTIVALIFGVLLGIAAIKFRVEGDPMVEKIDAILPQTQCGQCGYPGCKPYAKAIASGEANINQCPPGGQQGVIQLADLLGVEPQPLNEEFATASDDDNSVAIINEETCIGCTKCIQVCPVDAIVGAAKQKHVVLTQFCTGCKLCLSPVCPVEECIELVRQEPEISDWRWPAPGVDSDLKQRVGV